MARTKTIKQPLEKELESVVNTGAIENDTNSEVIEKEDNIVTTKADTTKKKYSVTVIGGVSNSKEYCEGEKVTITADKSNEEFDGWNITGVAIDDNQKKKITFTMPCNDVHCVANFKEKKAEEKVSADNNFKYIVKDSRETYLTIAQRFGVSLNELLSMNNLSQPRRLCAGDVVVVKYNSNYVNDEVAKNSRWF